MNIMTAVNEFQQDLSVMNEKEIDNLVQDITYIVKHGETFTISGNGIIFAARCDQKEIFSEQCSKADPMPILEAEKNTLQCVNANITETNGTFCGTIIHIPDAHMRLKEKVVQNNDRNTVIMVPDNTSFLYISFHISHNLTQATDVSFSTSVNTKNLAARYSEEFSSTNAIREVKALCAFLDKGELSTEGCTAENWDAASGNVTCRCNHTTMFAVLLSVTGVEVDPALKV